MTQRDSHCVAVRQSTFEGKQQLAVFVAHEAAYGQYVEYAGFVHGVGMQLDVAQS